MKNVRLSSFQKLNCYPFSSTSTLPFRTFSCIYTPIVPARYVQVLLNLLHCPVASGCICLNIGVWDGEPSVRVVIYVLLFTLQETLDFVRHLSDYVDGLTDRPPTPSLVKGVLVDIRLTREIEKW